METIEKIKEIENVAAKGSIDIDIVNDEILLKETIHHFERIETLGSVDVTVRIFDLNTGEEDYDYIPYEELSDDIIDKIYNIVQKEKENREIEEEKTRKRISD